MKKNKRLGQVFLHNKKYLQRIADSADIGNKVVCEIGPGKGNLTAYLISKAKLLYCIEIDSRFAELLRGKFSGVPNIKIIRASILNYPLYKLGRKVVVIGNIPYQITTPLIKYLVTGRRAIKKAYLTLQKEFAEKLTAVPSTPQYSFFSCYVRYYAKVTKKFDIPAQAFYPMPEVNSSFVEIDFSRRPRQRAKNPQVLFKVIRQAFNQRRKRLVNSLSKLGVDKELLISLCVDFNARAQDVALEQYIAIADSIC